MQMPTVLLFGGSDSSGGSGIQADLRAVAAGRGHALTALTAITAQGPAGVCGSYPATAAEVRAQAEALLSGGISPGAVKCGMLVNAGIVETVASLYREYSLCNLVIDPVISSSSGQTLLDNDGVEALCQRLLPLSVLVTPNIPEAERMTGLTISDAAGMRRAAAAIASLGPAVLLKGGHSAAENISDILLYKGGIEIFTHKRFPVNPRGTGCFLASSIALHLAAGKALAEAVAAGVEAVVKAIEGAVDIGGILVIG